jgi:ring-1,2-phenylacetyl-CoA epoxidase subunit PaaE
MNNTVIYTIIKKIQETKDVTTLELKCGDPLFQFKAGQFITVFFPETGHMEGKSYSISSSPKENCIRITVKKIGVFSSAIVNKNQGEVISGSLPYGYFYPDLKKTSLVMVAGGIAIAPIRSIIVDTLRTSSTRKIILLYCNKTKEETVFKNEFNDLMLTYVGRFEVRYYVTKEQAMLGEENGRIPISHITEKTRDLTEREYFICGSIAFVRYYWKGLRELGVREDTIYTEAFFN